MVCEDILVRILKVITGVFKLKSPIVVILSSVSYYQFYNFLKSKI